MGEFAMKDTLVEIVKINENDYEINCSKHGCLYDVVPAPFLAEAMLKIADVLASSYNERCYFTIEK